MNAGLVVVELPQRSGGSLLPPLHAHAWSCCVYLHSLAQGAADDRAQPATLIGRRPGQPGTEEAK